MSGVRPPFPHPPGWSGARVVFFDCDSTLSAVEGIDELGARRGAPVAELTRRSMAGAAPLESVYRLRLEQVRPGAGDLEWLAGRYAAAAVPGAAETVAALRALGIVCHVVSGGLLPAVRPFAVGLGFAPEAVHAVPYDPADPAAAAAAAAHPLARRGGKPGLIAALSGPVPRRERLLVGDGASDLEAAGAVGLFAGFGGVVAREEVAEGSPLFLEAADLAPVAVLAAGAARWKDLAATAPELARRGAGILSDPARARWRSPPFIRP